MAEANRVWQCDECKVAQDAEPSPSTANGWQVPKTAIVMAQFGGVYHFCSWRCAGMFADRKIAETSTR